MQITKEQLGKDIETVTSQLEQAKAAVGQLAGALSVLKSMNDYLDKPEEVAVAGSDVTQNATPSSSATHVLPAVPVQAIAEAVAGPGATATIVPAAQVVAGANTPVHPSIEQAIVAKVSEVRTHVHNLADEIERTAGATMVPAEGTANG